MKVLRASMAYWALIFALGFVLGTVRTLWGAETLGETRFVLFEIPVLLASSWVAARWLLHRFGLTASSQAWSVGVIAFALLLAAEAALAAALSGEGPGVWLSSLLRTPGLYGLLGQMVFGLIPWLVHRTTRVAE